MPRKSIASASGAAPTSPTTAPADASMLSNATEPKSPTSKAKKQQEDNAGIDDLLLPRSLTSRIARGILPANTSIQKDAVLALTKSATVFISYLASHANELTSRKTISPQDVLTALKEIEMEQVMDLGKTGEDGRIGGRLERELEVYEEVVRGKRKGYREKVKARESGVSQVDGEGEGEERGEPQKKRARRMSEDPDEDSELLDAQLNGPEAETAAEGAGGPANGNVFAGDETEDDPEIEDENEDEDDAPDNENEDDEVQDQNDEDENRIDMEDSGGRSRMILAPNGRAEVGSEDDSD